MVNNMDMYDKAEARLEAKGFVFIGASGIHGCYYKHTVTGQTAYLFASGAVRYTKEVK
jgi:hypothetical protein